MSSLLNSKPKPKRSKTVDLSLKSGRVNLLKQRLVGNTVGTESTNLAQTRDSSSSIVSIIENSSGDVVQLPSRSLSVSSHTDNSRRIIEDNQFKEELKRKLREENEKKLEQMKQFTIDILLKCNKEKQKIKSIELNEKSERLGHVIIKDISGTPGWCGGTQIEDVEHEIEALTQKIEAVKKMDQHKNSDAINQRKSTLQASLKEKKNILRQLEEERASFICTLRLNSDQSEYKVNQELNEDRYILTDLSGRGGCSEVWKAYDKKETRYVAIKIQEMKSDWADPVKENFIKHSGREIMIMKSTQHQNVIEFYEYFYIGNNTLAMVMEYCSGGDLSLMLKKRGRIPEKEAKYILAQIINGLLALRSKDKYVIHYDLKPGNILFNDEGTVKITDFGLSKIIEDDTSSIELTSQGTGTYFYAAPETFQRGKNVFITKSVDTWSLGIIFYEMIYGSRPFDEGQSQISFAHQIDKVIGKVNFPQNIKLSQEGKSFIEMCLIRDPVQRPELPVLVQDSYIKQMVDDMNA